MKNIKLILTIFLMLNIVACSEKDVTVENVQIKPVKEIANNKDEQILNIAGVELKEEFKVFDEAHYKKDSLDIFNYDTYIYMELNNEDYQSAYDDYLSYLGGYYPENASCVVKNKEYLVWEGKGYKFGIQLDLSNTREDLYLFKWTDIKTKETCMKSLEEFYNKGLERLDKIDEIRDKLDEQYPEIEEELREIYYTNNGYIKSSDNKIKRDLTDTEINIIKDIIRESTVDVGDSKFDLENEYYIIHLTSDDGLITYELVADDKSKEFYIKEGRIIDNDEDARQNNQINEYIFSLINKE